jgi:PST family polysaccharide transporter
LISFLIVPVAMGMLIVAPEMVATFLKGEWTPMVVPFQILCLVSTVKPLSATTSVLFTSTGRPVYNFRAGLVVIVILVPMIALLIGNGIVGVAFAVLIAQTVGFVFNMYQVTKVLPATASRMPMAIAPALLASVAMMLGVTLVKAQLLALAGGTHTAVTIVAMVVVGGLIYSTVIFLIQRALVNEVIELALRRFRAGRA